MAKPQSSKEERRLLGAGKVLTSEEVEFLNDLENIVQLSTWLDSRVCAPTLEAKRKLLYAFRLACKKARLQQAEDEESLVPLMWNMGGHRIVYTMADEELLLDVLRKLRPKFEATLRWCATLAKQAKKKKQTTLHRYLKKKAGGTSSTSSTEAGEEGDEDASSSNSVEAYAAARKNGRPQERAKRARQELPLLEDWAGQRSDGGRNEIPGGAGLLGSGNRPRRPAQAFGKREQDGAKSAGNLLGLLLRKRRRAEGSHGKLRLRQG